jgi:hypothetical protein
LAAEDPALAAKRYESAAEAYKRVVDSPGEVALRSLAEIGLATALKNQARFRPAAEQRSFLDRALDHYLRVFYQKNLRPGESPDLATVRQAGLAAAELAESQQKWDEALGIYRRLQAELPQLRERMEKKILQALQAKEKAAGTK